MSPRVVDAHLHVWDVEQARPGWLGPEHGVLDRTWTWDDAAAELAAGGVDGAVLVQADDTLAETDALLALHEAHGPGTPGPPAPAVLGVVGWLPLERPDELAAALADRAGRLCGVRQLVHDDPRPDVLLLPEVAASLELLAQAGLPLDVPDAWPRHLDQVTRLADAHPDLVLVLDHLGKPPRADRDDLARWATSLAALAERPNVVAKVSGLHAAGAAHTPNALREVLDHALACFGAERLMHGSDWPMTVPHGGYAATHTALVGPGSLLAELSPAEQEHLLSGTATRTYLTTTRLTTRTEVRA